MAARETRSQAKTRKYLESLHPQCAEAFKEGLGSILRQWTALELAIHHQWGGKSSKEKADELNSLLADMFMNPEKVYKDDVSLVLEDFMEVNFNTICEDGSADEVSDLLCTMWRQCSVGDFTLVHNALAREYVRHEAEILNNSQGVTADGDADDEMMDDVNEEDDAAMEDEDNADINDVADTAADVDMNQVSAEIVPNTSLISKKNRILVYSYLFKEGTLVAKKDFNADKHSDSLPIPNLEVLLLLRSFKSKGIEYLRQYLALPAEIVPATLKKAATAEPTRPDGFKGKSTGPGGEFNPEFQRDRGNRDGYRR
eukprot:gene31185-40544_t